MYFAAENTRSHSEEDMGAEWYLRTRGKSNGNFAALIGLFQKSAEHPSNRGVFKYSVTCLN